MQKGFTLLEVLVSLVLLGFLLAALGQGLRFGLVAWDLQDRQLARIDALDATDRSLRFLITEMEPGSMYQPAMKGTAEEMTFLSRLPAALGDGLRADMNLSKTASGHLVLRWRIHRHENSISAQPQPTETVLLDGVQRIQLSYWRTGAPGVPGAWLDTWSQPGLPALVRLHVEFGENDSRHWPDIVAAPILESMML